MTRDYRTFVHELFAGLAPIKIRRVFNFDGLYRGDVMFGLVAHERVFLKTDEKSRKAFVNEGAGALHYCARDGADVAMSYYELPTRLYDEPDEAAEWARTAYEIASRSPAAARKERRRHKNDRARQPTPGRRRS